MTTSFSGAKNGSLRLRQGPISAILLLLAGLNCPAVLAQATPADLTGLCSVPPISFSSQQLMQPGHVKVQANRAEIIEQQVALFTGNVDIISDTAMIHAEQAQINENGKEVFAQGDVTYNDAQLQVKSDSVAVSSIDQSLSMQNTKYWLTGFVGHGAADNIQLDTSNGLQLNDVSFTTCPLGGEDWQIKASEISIGKNAHLGEAKNTRFYVGGVPVFYLPYFAFPVSNQRQTGLLFPNLDSSSSNGLEYEQPFYWNIAPNYDMTLSPRLLSNRGLQLKTEFRYLTERSDGQINLEYLPSDNRLDSQDRYFYRLFHNTRFSEQWQLNVDYNGLSDDNYIVDLGSEFYNRADTHLYKTVAISYYDQQLDFSLQMRDFEIIGDHPDTYRALPEARINYRSQLGDLLEWSVTSELAYFDNTNEAAPTALRWHIAPTIALPYQRQWGELSAEATVFNTYYRQDNVAGTQLEEEVNRTLGQVRLYSALYFERPQQWFGEATTMTLEPKAQYLYTSYKDQSNIGRYDSAPLLTDVNGLFRGQEFTGLDRISDNNQITVGVTSRIIDQQNREQLVVSLGQIFYLRDNQVSAAMKDTDRSALAAEVDWRVGRRWFVHSDVQVTTETDKIERSSVALEYRRDDSSLVQLTHRFVRDLSGETIDQLGVSASWPINQNWHWVGRTYRDLERNRSVENYVGLQYESCCWAVRVVAQRSLSNRFDGIGSQSTNEYDSGISLQFIFKGIGSRRSNRAMLEDGMFGYRQPYNLN